MFCDRCITIEPMSKAESFDRWIRSSFVQLNTELENLYFAQDDRARVEGCGDSLKATLRDEGHVHVAALLAEGNTGDGFESAFGVLGSVGMYLGALRRHELTNPMREERSPFVEASSLALHVGASLGMAPRFATAHLATHNRAVAGLRKSFTSLPDEFLFIDENTRGILSLQRAADALTGIVNLGVSSPVADVMFATAKDALRDLLAVQNRQISIENIQKTVADYYKIRISDMHSKKRSRAVARPRQVAVALAKELTQLSLPEIGSNFGGRYHTTVLHACHQIAKLRESVPEMTHDVNFLLQVLRN